MLRVATFSTVCTVAAAILAVNRYEMTTNEDVISGAKALITNTSTGILVNIEARIMENIEKLIAYGRFNVPEDKFDQKYRKELLRTVVDVEKVVNGVTTNFLAKSVMDVLKGNMNVECKFPIQKGFIKFTNLTVTDKYYPPIFTKGLFFLRFVGKLAGMKKMIFVSEYETYIEILR